MPSAVPDGGHRGGREGNAFVAYHDNDGGGTRVNKFGPLLDPPGSR